MPHLFPRARGWLAALGDALPANLPAWACWRGKGFLSMFDMMTEPRAKVLPKSQLLTESLYMDLVADIIFVIKREYGIKEKGIAERLGVGEDTIKNAVGGKHKLNAPTLLNLLTISPSAIEILLHYFDRRSVPLGAKCDTDPLVSVAGAIQKLAVAASHNGPNDRDCLDMEASLDAAIEALCGLKSRCLDIREARAK